MRTRSAGIPGRRRARRSGWEGQTCGWGCAEVLGARARPLPCWVILGSHLPSCAPGRWGLKSRLGLIGFGSDCKLCSTLYTTSAPVGVGSPGLGPVGLYEATLFAGEAAGPCGSPAALGRLGSLRGLAPGCGERGWRGRRGRGGCSSSQCRPLCPLTGWTEDPPRRLWLWAVGTPPGCLEGRGHLGSGLCRSRLEPLGSEGRGGRGLRAWSVPHHPM